MAIRNRDIEIMIARPDRRRSSCFGVADINPTQEFKFDEDLDFASELVDEFDTPPLESSKKMSG